MTRSAAFTLARKRVQETGKPWLVTHERHRYRGDDSYETSSAYDPEPWNHDRIAWISVNGSERVYDGLGPPEEAANG